FYGWVARRELIPQRRSRRLPAGLLDQPFYGWVAKRELIPQRRSRRLPAGLLGQPFYGWVARRELIPQRRSRRLPAGVIRPAVPRLGSDASNYCQAASAALCRKA